MAHVYLRKISSWREALPVLIGAALALWSAIEFLDLADDIREGETDRFDNTVLSWLAAYRSSLWTKWACDKARVR